MGDEKLPKWTADVPEPEAIVVTEDGKFNAELINYVQKGGRVKDIRVRGPVRRTRREARKDANELKIAAYKGGGTDPALFHVRARRKELETVVWREEDLTGKDDEEEREKERLRKIKEEESKQAKKQDDSDHVSSLARLSAQEGPSTKFKPVGPKWERPGSMCSLPVIKGHPEHSWFIHEKQDSTGKYRAWLFFNSATGKYYRQKDSGVGYIQTGVPNNPQEFPINIRLGSANLASKAGKKLDMAVLLPELHKTGFLLKQSLGFLDKPSALFVLCDGLRNAAAASEFCAKKLHTVLLPKLSARATEWEDFELMDVVRDAVEALDTLLLESPACMAGSALAVGLLAGTRLVLGSLGGTRCVVCKPAPAAQKRSLAAMKAAPAPWTSRLVAGGDAHTAAAEDERKRIESASSRIFAESIGVGGVAELTARSATASELAAIADERERILTQVTRAANPFATLGIEPKDLRDGPASIRKIFRKRSVVVHPDKVGEELRQRAGAVFAKLEAATSAVEAMLSADAAATTLLAQVDAAQDSGKLASHPSAAAQLLGVAEGSDEKVVKQAAEKKFRTPLGHLQRVSRPDVERGLRTIDLAEETLLRATQLWSPPAADEAVRVTRALGCKDLKSPVPLLNSVIMAECIELEPGAVVGVALLSDGLRSVTDDEVARQLSRHYPARPRAAALRIALDSASKEPGEAVGAICGFFDFEGAPGQGQGGPPAAKRARTDKAQRVRISHILLRWEGLKNEDQFARPGMPAPKRTQAAAERELLELLEELLAGDAKTLAARFKKEVLKRSECGSAQNVPYADLGWIERGEAEPALEAAAFNAPAAGLSDVVISSRGAHLMYRLA